MLRGQDEGYLQVPFSRRVRKTNPGLTEGTGQAAYYVGAAHAIRKRVFEKCGLYQQDLVYGHEELDLAYDAIKKGFQILYLPEVVVLHEPGRSVIDGRMNQREIWYNIRNRIWLAYKHLPWLYFVSYVTLWTLFYGIRSLRDRCVLAFLRGVNAGVRGLLRQQRDPLKGTALAYVKRHFGRLWY